MLKHVAVDRVFQPLLLKRFTVLSTPPEVPDGPVRPLTLRSVTRRAVLVVLVDAQRGAQPLQVVTLPRAVPAPAAVERVREVQVIRRSPPQLVAVQEDEALCRQMGFR